jgi:hypothetical protein
MYQLETYSVILITSVWRSSTVRLCRRPLLAIRTTGSHSGNAVSSVARARAASSSLSLRPWLETNAAPVAFAIAGAGAVVVALIQGPKPFYGDSGTYWSLASSFTRNGHFSLLNFQSPLRGYAMALITYALQALARGLSWSSSSVVKLFNGMLFALIGAVLAPRIAQATWPVQRWGVWRRVALAALLSVFWSGDLNYPLSDFPGLALALLAVVAISHPRRPGWMLIAGIAGGLAVDVRPAYLLLVPMLVAIAAWTWLREPSRRRSLVRCALCVGLLVIGFAVASLPQSLSSHRHYHTWSFIPGGPSLTDRQLTAGTRYQRYDTFAKPEGQALAMVYPDVAGERLLEAQAGNAIGGPVQYGEMTVSHPLVMTGIIVRHLVNGLDMRYSTVYVEHIDSGGHLWLRLAGFLLVFLAIVRLLWPAAKRSLGPTHWRYPAALLLCCFTSLFTAIETRYMLPVWLLAYMLVLAPGWPSPVVLDGGGVRRFLTPAVLAAGYLVFMAAAWYVVSGASARVSP